MKLPSVINEPKCRQRCAFGLIECLVAVAVIGVLAAILFPVMSKARASGDLAKCRSNLRQIGTAYHLYAYENNNTLPGKDGIDTAFKAIKKVALVDLQPYIYSPVEDSVSDTILEGVWRCPAGPQTWITYSPNTFIWGLDLKRLRSPSNFAMMWDRGGTVDSPPGTQNPGVAWHGEDYYNALYADGHVDGITKKKLQEDLLLVVN